MDEIIVVVIEGEPYDVPEGEAVAFATIVQPLIKELPDQYLTTENTEIAVRKMIRSENLYDRSLEEEDLGREFNYEVQLRSATGSLRMNT